MKSHSRFLSLFSAALLAFTAGVMAPFPAAAATLDIPNVPLPVNTGSTANIFLEMDDSGSMDRDILTKQHFTTCMYNPSLGCDQVFMYEHMYDQLEPAPLEGDPVQVCVGPLDLNCDGICSETERNGNLWDVNCSGSCDAPERIAPWDSNCNGVCDVGNESPFWDQDCNGICEGNEDCPPCAAWDADCNGICDWDERVNCVAAGCTIGEACAPVCEPWDENCDGICELGVEGADWDLDCDGVCDVGVESADWDLDCNGVCDVGVESRAWDLNCSGFCDDGEACICDPVNNWDTNCNLVCDFGEVCPDDCNSPGADCATGCELWDLNCNGVCDVDTEAAVSWDLNCNGTCEDGESCLEPCQPWDTDCNGRCDWGESCPSNCARGDTCYDICEDWDLDCDGQCDVGVESAAWDLNCNGSCDIDEPCYNNCETWDSDCDGYCDWRENCPSSCGYGQYVNGEYYCYDLCADWDTNCDGYCQVGVEGAATSWDTNCNGVCDAGTESAWWDTNCNGTCEIGIESAELDTNCDGICDASERGANDWDDNCNGLCDAAEQSAAWDTDCDGVCDVGTESPSWDTNCNSICDYPAETCPDTCQVWDYDCDGVCDTGESCPGSCEAWDSDCDGRCDWGENCPAGCSSGNYCACEWWDTDCDGNCDWNENCGTHTTACPSDDPNCNCPASDPYCVTRGDCPISNPNCDCLWWEPYCNTDGVPTCPSTDPDCNCPDSDPFCVTRGDCPVSNPDCNCPSWDTDCVTNADSGIEDDVERVANIGGINSLITQYLEGNVSAPLVASAPSRPAEGRRSAQNAPDSGKPVPPPSLPEVSGSSRPMAIGDGQMDTFEYMFDTSDNVLNIYRTYERYYTGVNENHFDWRARSSDLNVLFFNPDVTYEPWVAYSDAAFSAARSQPVSTLDGYTDLRNLDGFFYHYWIDDMGFTGPQPDGTNSLFGANGIIDQWDSHVKVTVGSLTYSCELFTYRPDGIGLNLKITALANSDPLCLEALGRNGTLAELQQNVANWYQYYRKRTLASKAAVARVVTDQTDFRYGLSLINDTSTFVEMPPADTIDYTDHNNALIATYLGSDVGGFTPLRRGLERVGDYYAGSLGRASPIIEECQKNFAILFTDGYWNGGDPGDPNGDFDGDTGVIGSDDALLADVAKYFYDTDLAPQFADVVPADEWDTATHQHMVTYTIGFGISGGLTDTDADGWPNQFNPFAYTGPWYLLDNSDDQKKCDDMWHTAWNGRGAYYSASDPEQLVEALKLSIEDIGNRSGSSAGAAATAGSLSEQSQIFQAKYDASDWHGELLAYPVNVVTGDLDVPNWEAGALLNARPESWFNNQVSGRHVFTWDHQANSGIPFLWSSLNPVQQGELHIDPDSGDPDGEGEARLQYIRGSSTNEGVGNGYRVRINKLGDLVHSSLQYVGVPPFFYSDDVSRSASAPNAPIYRDFRMNSENRTRVLYVGANDGMLHGFNAETGAELLAYVPDDVIPKLNKLTSPNYTHEFFVDGGLEYGDVFFNVANEWRSVLAGALRGGGQGVYALDITDPDNFTASDVLWEFTDEVDADLGNVMGKPQIKKMANDEWAIIISSGYNNTDIDGAASLTGESYVFVLFIEKGTNGWSSTDYAKIHLPGADGLSTPAVADVDGDNRSDFIYVGDINGNMWKLDVTDSSPSNWNVAFGGAPLFTATESTADGSEAQAITVRPAIKTHPLGINHGVLVMFGTGKYYEIQDDTTEFQPVQSVYAIWDRNGYYNRALKVLYPDACTDRTDFQCHRNNFANANGFNRNSQLINPDILVDSASNTRIIDPDSVTNPDGSIKTPQWFDTDGNPEDRGWVVDLPEVGERVNQPMVLRDDVVFFVTLIPEENPCVAGSTGWLMALNADTGLATYFPVFDISGDDEVNEADILNIAGAQTQVSGVPMQAMPNLPAFLYDDRPGDLAAAAFPPSPNSARSCGASGARTFTYTTQQTGAITKITTAPQPLACGRQNWMQNE